MKEIIKAPDSLNRKCIKLCKHWLTEFFNEA